MQLSERHHQYWRANLRITAVLLGSWFFVTFVIGFFARDLNFTFFGWPFSFWVAAQDALIVYVGVMLFAVTAGRSVRPARLNGFEVGAFGVGLKSFEGRSNFSTWLYRLATNVCLMKIRHRETEPAGMLPLEDFLPRHENGEQPTLQEWPEKPEEILLTKESREKMMEALDRLPAEYRAVFVLRDIEGFSNAEAGEALGISVAAVKSRLHRARLFVWRELSAQGIATSEPSHNGHPFMQGGH